MRESLVVYSFDPIQDPRWARLVGRHPSASVFHTAGWLRSLQRTYRFVPIAFTTSPPTDEELRNALVFCAVRSWLTGRRLVSLPFSDHCAPLVADPEELRTLCLGVERYRIAGRWKYAELRPVTPDLPMGEPFHVADTYYFHRLDLRPTLGDLLRGFHLDSIQRRIRRAERERMQYEEGRSDALLDKLYHLLGLTRQRHRVPLQPLTWFRNLVDCLGDAVSVRVVSTDGHPAAGVLTLTHGKTIIYKYGGSDDRHHRLGAMPFLFWEVIQDAKRIGAEELDLGRTDRDNDGLRIFKDRWSAKRSTLTYWRSPAGQVPQSSPKRMQMARGVFDRLPAGLRQATANLIYRHLG